jgi:riboflavin kinase/FMN adenylyltransferase
MILEQGIDQILILPFTPEIAALGPEDFVREILVDKLKARAVLVGANFHFGKRAAGDAGTLEELGERYSFETGYHRAGGVAQARDIEQRDSALRSRRATFPRPAGCWAGLTRCGARWCRAKAEGRSKPCPR